MQGVTFRYIILVYSKRHYLVVKLVTVADTREKREGVIVTFWTTLENIAVFRLEKMMNPPIAAFLKVTHRHSHFILYVVAGRNTLLFICLVDLY